MNASHDVGIRAALVPAAINGLINGAIAWHGLRAVDSVPLSVDAISSTEKTVWSEIVVLAFGLSAVLGVITAALFQRATGLRARPVFPALVLLALEHAVFLFGATIVVAVLWQRIIGTVSVSPLGAAALVALAAAIITTIVDIRIKRALLR